MCQSIEQGGVRCPQHLEDQIEKMEQQLSIVKSDIMLIEQEQREAHESMDDYEGSALEEEHQESLENLHERFDNLMESLGKVNLHYNLTVPGRSALEEAAEDPNRTPAQRLMSATELQAAENRLERQKRLARALQNPETTKAAKLLSASIEVSRVRAEHAENEERLKNVNVALSSLKEQLELAEAIDDKERVVALREQIGKYVKEQSYLEAQLRQQLSHLIQTEAWLDRYADSLIDKSFGGFEKTGQLAIKYLL